MYHIKLEYLDLFDILELERAPKYDNYSNDDVFKRILSLKKSSTSSLSVLFGN